MRKTASICGNGIALVAGLSSTAFTHIVAAEATHSDALETVLVTAERREENLQDTSIGASVLSGDMLAAKGVNGLYSLQYAAPSLTVADYGSANVLNIRGIGRSAVDIELPSGVVLYRDGFPTFPGYFQNEPYFDIAAVEVLRGPQGTFVGKSAAGGAIFIRTQAPQLNAFSGMIEGEVASYDKWTGTAVLNTPISDTFGLRFAYHHEERGKPLVDSLSGPYTGRPGEPKLDSGRVGALWKPNDNLSVDMRVDISNLNFGGNLTSSSGTSLYHLVQDANYQYLDHSTRAVADVKYTFDDGPTLSSVTGYQRAHTQNNFDRNGNVTSVDIFDSEGIFTLYSQEFNLISKTDGPFSYVAGVFAQRTDSDIFDWPHQGFNFYNAHTPYPYLGLDKPYIKREDEISGFVDGRYKFTEQWELEVGLRYSSYKLDNDTSIVLGTGLTPPTIPFFSGKQHLDENDLDGKVTLTYKIAADQNVFALISRGHVVGGFNIVGGAPFDEERIYDYEVGWKGTWADGHVRTQTGAYYQTLSNYQAQFASVEVQGQNILQNAEGNSTIYGLEASAQARFGGFNIDAAAAYMHSDLGLYRDVIRPAFIDPTGTPITIDGGTAPFSPGFSLNVGMSYEFRIDDESTLTPRIDFSHVSEQNGALFEGPETTLPARTLVNAGLRLQKDKIYIDAYMTNLTNHRYLAGVQDLGAIWYPGAPRQYGVKIGYDF
jgi:iron complex outermembrane recepter protein